MISNQMDKKDAEAKRSKQNTQSQILLVESDNTKIQSKTNEYTKMIENLQNLNDNKKDAEAKRSKQNTQSQILLVESDNTKIQSKTNEYTKMIENLQNLNDKITDATKTRDAIPNLLNSIMFIIPESVQITGIQNTSGTHIVINAQSDKYEQLGITGIQNTSGTHIVINAQSDKYEQLGMFKAKIETGNYLTNVISTAGQKDGSVVTVKIEGDLP